MKFQPGCGCCSCGTRVVRTTGCGGAFDGCFVELKQGATVISSGTTVLTGGNAEVSLGFPTAGNYSLTITPPSGTKGSRFDITTSGAAFLSCSSSTITVAMTVKSAYLCCGGGHTTPVAKTLHITNSTGTYTTTFPWPDISLTSGTVTPVANNGPPGSLCVPTTSSTIPVKLSLSCAGIKQFFNVIECCFDTPALLHSGDAAIYNNGTGGVSVEADFPGSIGEVAYGPITLPLTGLAPYSGFCTLGVGAPIPGDHIVSE